LLVASLFRNFLLAERIMRSLNCTPVSYPKLPPTYQHPMWYDHIIGYHFNNNDCNIRDAWDLAVDLCLSQLPDIIEENDMNNPTVEYKVTILYSSINAYDSINRIVHFFRIN
jgi:regulator-associated protein of mTOR